MKLDYLLQADFWFNGTPTPHTNMYIPLAVVFALLIIGGAALIIFAKGDFRKLAGKYIMPLLSGGILGFIALFARYEELPWLASRFFLGLVMMIFLIWILILLLWSASYVPRYLSEKERKERFEKYLPKKAHR